MAQLAEELAACRWPDDAVATLVADARDLSRQGKLVEAYDALDEAQRLSPGDPEVHYARAEIFFMEREFSWALKENLKALGVEATADRCYLQGQCLCALNRHDEAMEFFRLGLEAGDCSRGRHLLAQCLERTGEARRALVEYREALRRATVIERDDAMARVIEADLSALVSRGEAPAP